MRILCAGDSETFSFAKPIGIGLINSSINLTSFISKENPKSLLFIGSAGSYGNLKPMDIFSSSSCGNVEIGYLLDNCYTPIDNMVRAKIKNVSCETTNKKDILVNSSNYITTNKIVANKFLENGFEAENMEFFSVLTVANKFNIPVLGIFIITNYCDNNAHRDFIKNHSNAKERLTLHVEKQVSKI